VRGLKLLIAGLLMLAGAVALLIFSDYSPAQLFIAGGACTLFGVVNLMSLMSGSDERGPPVSAGDMENARNLGRMHRYDSADSFSDRGP
jgi:hypothetical protein